ncbi:acyltransferase [Leeuwenhoekiella marinoflava]|uniref:Surface polysaccharide O-acyltransferase-like enzyme n=2 Tax=Leeuwenhoekiella marinoflava TaxID=988 RepID=A0A4Q0P6H2_9FLAO|nr:acyltransferase [Leeuwenhoekiella marinoflava]RXG21696.1 surface polysaccharide O-acyltransferase-like enzyme [Leeuwenhoekiella marinoflava]SHF75961.1 Surface polysaccharide O-acyltransferase, integral membrane enzyme [Leeuwenhoekiella marinoflava DSM 3653]
MKDRIIYYDLLRGLAIIAVISIHSTGIGYTFDNSSLNFNITVIWRQLINFAVPLFIAISGFFLANKKVDSKKSYLQFIKKQVPRVLIPYLLWSVVYLGIAYLRGTPLLSLIYRLVTFSSSVPFYFILLIIEYYLLLPLLQKLGTSKGLVIAALISGLSCFLIFCFKYFTEISLPIFVTGSAPSWLIFFVLGIYLRNNTIKLNNRALILLLISGLVLSIIETYILYDHFNDIGYSVTAVKFSSFVYSTFVILFAFKNANRNFSKRKLLAYIGEISFGIFLSHIFFMMLIKPVMNKLLPILKDNALLYQFFLITLTLSCCIIFALITRKINKTIAVKYLGQ